MTAKPALLAVSGVSAGYGGPDIIRDVSLRVAEGEIVTVVGPNGAGKSTLLKAILGVARCHAGSMQLGGEELRGLAPHHIIRRGVGYVPQRDNVFATMSVQDNVELALLHTQPDRCDERIRIVQSLFPRLRECWRASAGALSGGERQMVAIARALAPDPRVLLMDEPTAGLAPAIVSRTLDLISQINRNGVTILMVEQRARRALEISDRGYVLELGTNRLEGPGRELLDDPAVGELYLGTHGASS